MNRKINRAGFTLPELLVAMLAMSIMLVATGSLLVYAWMGWRRNAESLNMQRDAVIAMKNIAREVRGATFDEITFDNNGIYFNASSIVAADIPVSSGVSLDNFAVTTVSNSVEVGFTLTTTGNADRNTYRMQIYPRNEP